MANKKLHIAHFTNTYFPVMSGVVRSISTFRDAQEKLGHTVFVFGQDAPNHEDSEPFVFRYPSLNIPIRNYPATIPVSAHIDWVLPILKLDVIHAHHPSPMGTAASDKAEKLGVPLVFTHHTRYQEYANSMGLPEDMVRELIERQLADYMEKCQHIIAPSSSIKQMIEETYGIRERVTVIPTGIDLTPYQKADGRPVRQQYGWGPDQKVVISIGRLAPEKNFITLIEAMAIVMQKHKNVRLALIGDGPDKSSLEKLARKLNIADKVDFIGLIPFDEVPAHLKAADFFSFASVTETQGLVTMEAMAADLAVVAVDASGTSDIVEHEKDGLLTANTSQDLADGLERILRDEALAQRLRDGAKEKAQTFETIHVTKKMIEVYRQAIADKKAGVYIEADKRKPIFTVAWNRLVDKAEKWTTRLNTGTGPLTRTN
ncbi:MAG: glycosyltransferase [Anaerolineales bacterium]|nr:glycosyltransferase [Anaerolineales bacterium]